MARRKPTRNARPTRPVVARLTRPVLARPAGAEPSTGMPTDYRAGLLFFGLLELATYVTLATAKTPWFYEPKLVGWRNALIVVTTGVLLAAAWLWWMGPKTKRFGWLLFLAVAWLIVLTGRLVPMFVVAMHSAPVLVTIFVGQLAFGFLLPAAIRERRKATPTT